jgi:class 3 adenylate cyclase
VATGESTVRGLGNRAKELAVLHRWATEVVAGNPRLVVVEGIAGVGKSTLLGAFVEELRTAGVQTLVGRCSEGSDLPLLPLAPAVAALRGKEPVGAPSGALRAESDVFGRLALVQEVARLALDEVERRPVALAVEDVHWADGATLELLTYLAASVASRAPMRPLPLMLIVTTVPEAGSVAASRLGRQLAAEVAGRRLVVEGLDQLGVFSMLSEEYARPSPELLGDVVEVTGGNPAQVEALVEALRNAGVLEIRDGEMRARGPLPRDIVPDPNAAVPVPALSPDGDELAARLAALRDQNAVLLRAATPLGNAAFEAALEELDDAGVVAAMHDRVSFVHDDLRRAVNARLSPSRLRRLRVDIAERLDREMAADATGAGSRASQEIVHQLSVAGDARHALLEAHVVRAAEAAFRSGAWRDALRYYETALDAGLVANRARAAAEAQAATAAFRALDGPRALDHARRAVERAKATGDLHAWGTAALVAARVGILHGTAAEESQRALAEFIDGAGDHEPKLSAEAHAALGESAVEHFRLEDAWTHSTRARALVPRIPDPDTRHGVAAHVDFVSGLTKYLGLDLDEAARFFRDGQRAARRGGDTLMESWALGRVPLVQWAAGRLGDAQEAAAAAADFDRLHGWWVEYATASAVAAAVAAARGDAVGAERLGSVAADAHRLAGLASHGGMLFTALACLRAQRGDFVGAHAALDLWEREDAPGRVAFFRTLVDSYRRGERRPRSASPALLAGFRDPDPRASRIDLMSVSGLAFAIELAVLGDASALDMPEEAATAALRPLEHAYEKGLRFLPGWSLFVPRLVGSGYRLCGATAHADRWLRRALRDATRAVAPVEVARVDLELGRLLRSERQAEAAAHARAAIDAFRRLDLGPLLRDGVALAQELDGLAADTVEELVETDRRVIVVTDIVDSTPLAHNLGDRQFVALLRRHNLIVRRALDAHGGIEFKHTGDGIASWFLDGRGAIEYALEIQEAFRSIEQESGIGVRIGIASGDVVMDGNDLFGLAVITAFRVCDQAEPGGVLVAESVPQLVRSPGIAFDLVGSFELKGFANTQRLFSPRRLRA